MSTLSSYMSDSPPVEVLTQLSVNPFPPSDLLWSSFSCFCLSSVAALGGRFPNAFCQKCSMQSTQKHENVDVSSSFGDDSESSSSSSSSSSVSPQREIASETKPLNSFVLSPEPSTCVLSGAAFGDVPTSYSIRGLRRGELPVKGTAVHPDITPGFHYIVRQLDAEEPLFNSEAVCLQTIGIGYGKRFGFASDSLIKNDRFFWSDSNQEGYGFSLKLVRPGMKLTVLNMNNKHVATLEVISETDVQTENASNIVKYSENASNTVSTKGNASNIVYTKGNASNIVSTKRNASNIVSTKVQKKAEVHLHCSVTESAISGMQSGTVVEAIGVAVASKATSSNQAAKLTEVKNCIVNGNSYTLVPSQCFQQKRIVNVAENGSIPTQYNITDIYPHEMAVIGTFVDTRIVPDFEYCVRSLGPSGRRLFGGKAKRLLSIGRGYGKRISFDGNSECDVFWSDSHRDGNAFSLQVVHENDEFKIRNEFSDTIGDAVVYKLSGPQTEIESETLNSKKVRVNIVCHLYFDENCQFIDVTTRIKGTSLVEKSNGTITVKEISDLEFPNLYQMQDESVMSRLILLTLVKNKS